MRKRVFCDTSLGYYAEPDEYNSKDWWGRNFIAVIEDLLKEKKRSRDKLTAFEDSKICKDDKTDTLLSLAVSQYASDCSMYDKKILAVTKEYMDNVLRIEQMNQ